MFETIVYCIAATFIQFSASTFLFNYAIFWQEINLNYTIHGQDDPLVTFVRDELKINDFDFIQLAIQ